MRKSVRIAAIAAGLVTASVVLLEGPLSPGLTVAKAAVVKSQATSGMGGGWGTAHMRQVPHRWCTEMGGQGSGPATPVMPTSPFVPVTG